MADLEEIESVYKSKVEKEDEAYLKRLQEPVNKGKEKELEAEYRGNLKLLFSEYQKNVSKFLNQKDAQLFPKNETPVEEEKKEKLPSRFKVQKFSMSQSSGDEFKTWWQVFRFNFKINFRNFYRKFLPSWMILFLLTAKLEIINAYIELKFYIGSFIKKIFLKIKYLFIAVKNLFAKVFGLIKDFLGKVFKLKKNKEKTTEGEKVEEVKKNEIKINS